MARRKSMLEISKSLDVSVEIPDVNIDTLSDFEDCLEFPGDLTEVSFTMLGELFTNYTGFLSFVNEKLAILKLQQKQLLIGKRRRKALVVIGANGIKLQKQAAVYLDPEFRAFVDKIQEVEVGLAAYYNMLWTLKEYLRAVEFERDRRGMRIRADG